MSQQKNVDVYEMVGSQRGNCTRCVDPTSCPEHARDVQTDEYDVNNHEWAR